MSMNLKHGSLYNIFQKHQYNIFSLFEHSFHHNIDPNYTKPFT